MVCIEWGSTWRPFGTGLARWLTQLSVRTLILAGYHTDWCIEMAARHARELGFVPIVIGLTGLALVWMLAYFARSGARHRLTPVAIGLLLGGSVSNLLDRIRNGYVTDFIYLHWFSAFNAADSFIVVGVGLLLYSLFRGDEREGEAPLDSPRPR